MELMRRPGYTELWLHDGIEPLGPEASGRRQRPPRRPRRVTAGLGVLPGWGTSANQRRAWVNRVEPLNQGMMPLSPPVAWKNNVKESQHDDNLRAEVIEDQKPTSHDMGETDPAGLSPESLMFRDGQRSIDMVLAFRADEAMTVEKLRKGHRSTFQKNLMKEGLELELENERLSYDGKIYFLKIHIPWVTQLRIADIIGLKLPTRRFVSVSVKARTNEEIAAYEKKWYVRCRRWLKRIFDNKLLKRDPSFYGDRLKARREDQFLLKDRATEFPPSLRSLLTMQILIRAKYSNEGINKHGIRRLLSGGTYIACFPLHDGQYKAMKPDGSYTERQLLYREWAQLSQWYKRQPLWLVRHYFGDHIGMYFAWVGFYTKMLIAPAVVGSLCVIYGILTINSPDNLPSQDICNVNGAGNITLCPLCDKACSYMKLSDTCFPSQLAYVIDNELTLFFAVFMSFWSSLFLLLWTRKQSVIQWEWDLGGSELGDFPRPEYEDSVKTTRMNPVTGESERYLPPENAFVRRVAVYSAVFLMFALALGATFSTIVYRISMVTVIYSALGHELLKKNARLITFLSAAFINLIIIEILIEIYAKVAVALTNLEKPRTESEFNKSYTFKMFFFQCVNFYSSLTYIAFFKGAFFDHPGDHEARSTVFLRLKGDRCFPSGCLSELCILLTVIMVGKQTIRTTWKIIYPSIKNYWRKRMHRLKTLNPNRPQMPWEMDYHLQDAGQLDVFEDYLDMGQYGFVTLFVVAFPLAPLIALLNNICEIRLVAYKWVAQARRPLAERVEDIGAWQGVLRIITYMAVVSNSILNLNENFLFTLALVTLIAFVISVTSDFVPRLVYKYGYAANKSLVGYVYYTLSWFNTSDYLNEWGAAPSEWDPPQCAYHAHRNPPDSPNEPYAVSKYYWPVLASRLAFIVVFEHVVFLLTQFIYWLISKVPHDLQTQIKREALAEKEVKFKHPREGPAKRERREPGLIAYLNSRMDTRGPYNAESDIPGVRFSWDDEGSQERADLTIDEELWSARNGRPRSSDSSGVDRILSSLHAGGRHRRAK